MGSITNLFEKDVSVQSLLDELKMIENELEDVVLVFKTKSNHVQVVHTDLTPQNLTFLAKLLDVYITDLITDDVVTGEE